jgi:hypothetical protein
MNTESTDKITETIKQNTESINPNTEMGFTVEPVTPNVQIEKKPRKELTEESKQKRAEVLKKAREAKAEKRKTITTKPIPIEPKKEKPKEETPKEVDDDLEKEFEKIRKRAELKNLVKSTVQELKKEKTKFSTLRNLF